jgi:hypothetical protein
MEYGYCQEGNEAVKERGTIGITVNKGGRKILRGVGSETTYEQWQILMSFDLPFVQ